MSRVTLRDGRRVEAVLQARRRVDGDLVRLSDGSCWIITYTDEPGPFNATASPYSAAATAEAEAAANVARETRGGDGTFETRRWDRLSFGVWSNVKTAFEEAA